MTDLDFDEIDRAVNSLNNNAPAVGDDTTDQIEQPVVATSANPAETIPAQAGRRSSGQFMDVVHPSSDMRRAPLMMPERGSRPNINPSPQKDSTEESSALVETPAPTADIDSSMSSPSLPLATNEDADIDQISDEITNELNNKSDDSIDSPFLSDAKVEKRPLGAFSVESNVETFEQPESGISTDEVNSESKDSSQLPDELQDDLLKIESNVSVNTETVEPIEKVSDSDDTKQLTEVESITKPESVSAEPAVVPASIVQQYKEQPSSGDQSSGAIYDTNSYHKGLVAPVKKKASWLWIVWIVLLIFLGAGAGAAIYYFVIPML